MTDPSAPMRALLAAYCDATGLRVSLSYDREQVLLDIWQRGITPEDVTLAMKELKRLVDSRDPANDCYRPASLDFRNAMGQVDRLEERIARLKQERARAEARKPKPQVQHVDAMGTARLVDQPAKEPKIIDLPGTLRALAGDIAKQA